MSERARVRLPAVAAAVLVLAACGGTEERAQPPPTLPPALAERLAGEADAVAELLEAGDPCGAAKRATALHQATIAALNRPGEVPDALKEDLGAGAADLADRAQSECAAAQPPPPPPPPTAPPPAAEEEDEDDDEGRGKGKGKGKEKGKGKGKGGGKKEDD